MPSRLHRWDPESDTHSTWDMPEMITSMAVRENGQGLLVASHHGINFFDPETGSLDRQFAPEPDQPNNRCNDGAADRRGRFWFGTMQNNIAADGGPIDITSNSGSLYRLDPDLSLHAMVDGIGVSNTVCWSPDDTVMYFTDTLAGCIWAYDFDADTGAISGRREFARFDRGYPDGSTVDAEGYLWNARWEGGSVVRFAPDGQVDRVVEIDAPLVTSCAFGGAALGTLYVTTARYELSAETLQKYPQAGSLFAVDTGVSGLADARFAG
jgi:sugar lactone lactonase YvrE